MHSDFLQLRVKIGSLAQTTGAKFSVYFSMSETSKMACVRRCNWPEMKLPRDPFTVHRSTAAAKCNIFQA